MADTTCLTGAFENLLQVTVGITAVDSERARGDPVLRSLPASVVRQVAEEMTTAEEGDPTDPIASEAASAMRDLDAFERRLAGGEGEALPDSAKAATVRGVHRTVTGADAVITAQPSRKKAPIGVDGLSWSPNAPGLVAEVEAARRRFGGASLHKYTSRGFLYGYFQKLKLVNLRLQSIDERTQAMTGLRELNISGNRVSCLQNLPSGIIAVQAYGNGIQDVLQREPLTRCVHAGLGYNQLPTAMPVVRSLPRLMSLDLSWNALCDLQGTLLAVEALRPTLRSLDLAGNPLALTRGYRTAIEQRFKPAATDSRLEQLDSIPLPQEDAAAAAGFAPAAIVASGSDSDAIELTVQVLGASGIPLPRTVPGWLEAQEAAAAATAASAKKGSAKSKPKPKGKGKSAEPAPSDAEPEQAEPEWVITVTATPCLVKDSGDTLDPAEPSYPSPQDASATVSAAAFLEATRDKPAPRPTLSVRSAASVGVRDALAVHGVQVRLWLCRKAPQRSGQRERDGETASEAAAAGGAGGGESKGTEPVSKDTEPESKDTEPESKDTEPVSKDTGSVPAPELLGSCLATASSLLTPTDGQSAVERSRVPLRLHRLPQSTCDAVLAMRREGIRKRLAAEAEAEEAAEAAAGGKGAKKSAKGKKGAGAAEEAVPLTEEQEGEAAAAAADECEAMAKEAEAVLRVKLLLRLR
jgi:hypothetical protein